MPPNLPTRSSPCGSIGRLVRPASELVTARALALPIAPEPADGSDIDRATIEQALLLADGVVARAARDLGLSRQALYRRMEKLGLKSPVDPGRTSANG